MELLWRYSWKTWSGKESYDLLYTNDHRKRTHIPLKKQGTSDQPIFTKSWWLMQSTHVKKSGVCENDSLHFWSAINEGGTNIVFLMKLQGHARVRGAYGTGTLLCCSRIPALTNLGTDE